jgi:hypothetical protein
MPRKYSPRQKQDALEYLEGSDGDVFYAHQETGIPLRTLYTWHRELWLQQSQQQSSLPPLPDLQHPPEPPPQFSDTLSAMKFVRESLIKELTAISAQLKDDPASRMSPHQRALVISQLIDKVMKLDAHLKPYIPRQATWNVVFDGGYNTPPWNRAKEAETPPTLIRPQSKPSPLPSFESWERELTDEEAAQLDATGQPLPSPKPGYS